IRSEVFYIPCGTKCLREFIFCGSAIFCVSQELLFAIRTDLFFLLGINFGDFQKVPSQPRDKGPFISELKQR
ncbi:MAG: hypothetical protein MI923_00570, partial [Phycisphaerales bacterium]|nr:hypothetical protein [Phycisphaerales bacterium]